MSLAVLRSLEWLIRRAQSIHMVIFSVSLNSPSTIYIQVHPSEELALLARQEQNGVRNIFHLCETAEWHIPKELLTVLRSVRNASEGFKAGI